MKNLENYGVQEMDAMEIRSVDGGWIEALRRIALLMAVIHEVSCDGGGHTYINQGGITVGASY